MEQNKYHRTIELIKTPPELKAKTRNMLIAETGRRKSKRIWTIGGITSIAALFVLVIGASIWFIAGPGGWLGLGNWFGSGEPMKGSTDDTPQNMEMNFVSLSESTEPVRLASTFPLRQQISIADLPGVLPAKPPSGFTSHETDITAFFSEPSDTPDAIMGEAVYRDSSEGTVTVMFTDTAMLFLPVEIGGSFIEDVQVGVGFSETDGRLFAAFEKNGYTYLLTSEGVDRKDFIQVLVHFVMS